MSSCFSIIAPSPKSHTHEDHASCHVLGWGPCSCSQQTQLHRRSLRGSQVHPILQLDVTGSQCSWRCGASNRSVFVDMAGSELSWPYHRDPPKLSVSRFLCVYLRTYLGEYRTKRRTVSVGYAIQFCANSKVRAAQLVRVICFSTAGESTDTPGYSTTVRGLLTILPLGTASRALSNQHHPSSLHTRPRSMLFAIRSRPCCSSRGFHPHPHQVHFLQRGSRVTDHRLQSRRRRSTCSNIMHTTEKWKLSKRKQ